jgi:hypothetical protein
MSRISAEWRKPENIRIVAPLLGFALAIVFEIGVFFSFGRGWFVLFSLTDHFLFSLTAAPFAIILVLFNYLTFWPIWSFLHHVSISTNENSNEVSERSIWSKALQHRRVFFFCLTFFSIITFALSATFLSIKELLICFIIGMVVMAAFFLVFFGRNWATVQVFIAIFSTAVAFCFGVGYGYMIISSPSEPYIMREKSGAVSRGTLLMAGDRGILFLVGSTGATHFRRWEAIESVERERSELLPTK